MSVPRDRDITDSGCAEYRSLTRRRFLRTGAGASAAALAVQYFPAWLPRVVLAEATPGTETSSCRSSDCAESAFRNVPFADPSYYTSRSTIAVPRPDDASPQRGTALDDFFAFPQAMTPLLPAYKAGELLVIHAAGQINDSRSHFDAQRYMEVGKAADPAVITGWLGRHLASVSSVRSDAPLRGLGLYPGLRKTLVGAPRTLPIFHPEVGIGGSAVTLADRLAFLQPSTPTSLTPLRTTALDALAATAMLTPLDIKGYVPANGGLPGQCLRHRLALGPRSSRPTSGSRLRRSISADGTLTRARIRSAGSMFVTMTTSCAGDGGLHAMTCDRPWRPPRHRCRVVGVRRNVVENGSRGTERRSRDGDARDGQGDRRRTRAGQRLAGIGAGKPRQWSGPESDVDYRDVLAEIVTKRLANDKLSVVFPG